MTLRILTNEVQVLILCLSYYYFRSTSFSISGFIDFDKKSSLQYGFDIISWSQAHSSFVINALQYICMYVICAWLLNKFGASCISMSVRCVVSLISQFKFWHQCILKFALLVNLLKEKSQGSHSGKRHKFQMLQL